MKFHPARWQAYPKTEKELTLLAFNEYDEIVDKRASGFTFRCEPQSLGSVDDRQVFHAAAQKGAGVIIAEKDGKRAEMRINVIGADKINIVPDKILIDRVRSYPINIEALIGSDVFTVDPDALTWEVEDSRVCDVRNGVLKGIENGTTRVKGVFDGKEKELQVTVEIGEGTQIVESFDDASVFQLKTIGASNLSFSNEGLPAAWKHGLVMNFEFSSGRGPYIELSKEICFYGLPDSISLNLKNDDGIISGIDFYLENAADESMTQRLSLQPNGEQLVVVPFMKDGKMWDIRNFPIILRKIKMTLKPGVDGKKYQVPIGNLRAHYPEGMTKVTDVLKNNPFNIYASASALTVDYTLTETSNIRMALHSIDGKTVRSISKHQLFAGLYRENINIAALPSGVYILKIFVNETEYSQKIRKG